MSNASTKLAHLKFEASSIMSEARDMIDELRNCPPGHERANQLSQQLGSHLDRLSSSIENAQVRDDGNRAGIEPAPGAYQHDAAGYGYTSSNGNQAKVAGSLSGATQGQQNFQGVSQQRTTNGTECPQCGRELAQGRYAEGAENGYEQGRAEAQGYGSGGMVADGETRESAPIGAAARPLDNPNVVRDLSPGESAGRVEIADRENGEDPADHDVKD